jgi:hypothetical protein
MSSTKKPLDTDYHGPTYRPKGSGNYDGAEGIVLEGDDLPAQGEGASIEKLGDYLSDLSSVNRYHPNQGSTEAISHREVSGPPPVYDSYKAGGSVNNAGTDQTYLDDVLSHGAVKAKDFTNLGVGDYKNPKVAKGDINPFILNDDEPPVYKKGVQEDRGKGHTLLAAVPGHGSTGLGAQTKVGKVIEAGPHVIQKRTSSILENNRFHPSKGSPYVTDGAFSAATDGTMGSNQSTFGVYDPEAELFKIAHLKNIGRDIMVAGTGHSHDENEDLAALLPSWAQLGIPYVSISISDLDPVAIAGYKKSSGGYILSTGKAGETGWIDNEIDSSNTFGHLNSYFETFSGALPLGMIMSALGGMIAMLIQAAAMTLMFMLLSLLDNANAARRDPENPMTLPKGRKQYIKTPAPITGLIKQWLGYPELESEKGFFLCMVRGLGTFFGMSNLTGPPSPLALLDFVNALMEQSGFVASVMRSSTRDLEDVVNAAAQIRGSVVSIAGGIIAVIKSLGAAASIRFLMTCAKLGDILFIADNYHFAPYKANPDDLVASPATRLAKSRTSKTDMRSVLRHGALPSAYLLPVSAVTAAAQYELKKGQGYSALSLIRDKIAPNEKVKNGKIDLDYVKEIENKLDCEYVPFYFQDLRTNEIVAFHAFISSISDDYSPEWSSMSGYGRMDPIQVYNKTTRAISISFMIASTNPEDFDEMWWSINKLTSLVYPQWTAGTSMQDSDKKGFIMPFSQIPAASPIIRMRIGDLIKNNYSRFNLARIFGIGHNDKEGSSFNIAGLDQHADAEKFNSEASRDSFIDYMTKLRTPPASKDSENGFQNGNTAILKANNGKSNALKVDEALFGGLEPIEPHYIDVPVNTVIEIVKKEYINVPFLTLPGLGPTHPAPYRAKFPADSEMAKIYDGEFWITHHALLPDPAQIATDNPDNASLLTFPADGDINEAANPESNFAFFQPENNAIVRAFESTKGRGLGGVITSLSYDYADAPWETRKLGSRAPMWVKVSLSFTPIHDLPPGLDHDGFNRAPLYNVGDIMNNLSGPDMQRTETEAVNKADSLVTEWHADKLNFVPPIPRDPEVNGGDE